MAELSLEEARRLALGAQGFASGRPHGRVDRRHLRGVMNRLGTIQLDSVPVVIRTQYMPFFSRLGNYRTSLLDEIAYSDHSWFEAWAHEASLLPVESEPLWRWHKRSAAEGHLWPKMARRMEAESGYVSAVYAEVVERGPMKAAELTDPRPRRGDWWAGRSFGAVTLDWLWRTGALGVRRVGNFEKEYDLYERIVPQDVRSRPTPRREESMRALLGEAGRALGVATAADLVDYFRLPTRLAKPLLADLLDEGVLIETSVEGWDRPAYRHRGAAIPRAVDAAAILSPFDPVVWNRDRASRLFGFDYRIEIYVPAAKRRHGYYVMPMLWGDRLAGRFDLKTVRSEGVLHVKAAFAEPWVDHSALAPVAHRELVRLADLVGARTLRIDDRGDLAEALAAAG